MKTHYLASLLGLTFACATSSTAARSPTGPQAPHPMRAPQCTFDGGVLFSMTTRPNPQFPVDGISTSTTLHGGGGWTVVDTAGTRSGCLDPVDLEHIRTELRRARWQVSYAVIECMAIPSTFTDYVAFGKPVFTDAMCSGGILDGNSRKILDDAVKTLAAATAVPRGRAACGSLVPLFRIEHRSDVPGRRTWSAEVSVDGTLTFDATEPGGRHEHRTICLFEDQLAQLQANLAKQTWKRTRVKFACAAFVPEHDVYSVNGVPVYDERMCDPEGLTDADNARLAAIRSIIDQATAS
jgi:hypothetical protein